jgi:hypothetical protein
MEFVVPLLYSEVVGTEATPDVLIDLIRRMDWREVITRAIFVANASLMSGIEDRKHQQGLVKALTNGLLYDFKILRGISQTPPHDLVTREGLLALLRTAFIERREPAPDGTFQDVFVKANLAANEIVAKEWEVFGHTGRPEDLLASEIRSALLQPTNQHDALSRTDAFFRWSRTQDGVSDNYLPIKADFEFATGLPWLEYLATAYALASRALVYENWDVAQRIGIWFRRDNVFEGFPNPAMFLSGLDAMRVPLNHAVAKWKEEPSLSLAGFGPLWKQPVIQDGEWYTIPYPPLLTNAMGDGIYFTLLDSYDDARKSLFMPFYGEFFEDYIVERFANAYRERLDARTTPEVVYNVADKSSDFIIQENGDVVFVEVVAKRMKFVDSVLRLNKDSIEDDLRKGILCKVEQLDRNIRDFRDGRLLPSWPRPVGQRYFPVLVAPRGWPRIYALTAFLPAEGSAFLQDCEPIEMLSMGEVESIELALQRGMRFGELLYRKNRSWPQQRHDTLHNFLLTPKEKHLIPNVLYPVRARGGEVAKELIRLSGLEPGLQ